MTFQDIRRIINLVESTEKDIPSFTELKNVVGSNPRLIAISLEKRIIKPRKRNIKELAFDDDDGGGGGGGGGDELVEWYLLMTYDASGYNIDYEQAHKKSIPLKQFDIVMPVGLIVGVGQPDGYFIVRFPPGVESFDLAAPEDIDDPNYDMNSDESHQNVYWWMYEDDPRTRDLLEIFKDVVQQKTLTDNGPHGDSDGDPIALVFGLKQNDGPLGKLRAAANYSVEENSPIRQFIKYGNNGMTSYPPVKFTWGI